MNIVPKKRVEVVTIILTYFLFGKKTKVILISI